MRPGLVALAAAAATAGACLTAAPAGAATYPAGFEERTIVSGLDQPVSMAWAPDGRLVRNGPHRLRAVARDAAGNANISAVVRFRVRNERGRLGR
jgi:glucose/arabinose dehydrogenase